MTYQVYKTEGIVLASREAGEADRIFSIYAKDFGRLEITALGVRHLKSKLRYSLNVFSRVQIAFIRTNEFLRLVDAKKLDNGFLDFTEPAKFLSLSGLAGLVGRMVKGEEADPGLWQELKSAFAFLGKNNLGEKDLEIFQLLISLRILYRLGYVMERKEFLLFFAEKLALRPILEQARRQKKLIILSIENAFEQSHL